VYTSLNVEHQARARVNVRKRRSMEGTLGTKMQRDREREREKKFFDDALTEIKVLTDDAITAK